MKIDRLWMIFLCAFLFSGLVTTAYATPPSGGWEIIANGFRGQINLTVDVTGNVTGTWTEGTRVDEVTGLWDESSQKLLFVRKLSGDPAVIQVYTGYLFNSRPEGTFCSTGEFNRMMAGTLEAFQSTGATPSRNVFGWAMQQCVA
jgi:hypothetical protein